MNGRVLMYKLDFLIDTFLKHAERHDKENRELRQKFKEGSPNEPIPEYLSDPFNLPMALATICYEIQEIKNAR